MLADPRALAERAPDPTVRTLAHLVRGITETPWRLGPADWARAQAVGLSDAALVQVVLLSSFFGHLNRMADAVGIELDYPTAALPPHAEPATPPYLRPQPAEWPDFTRRSLPVLDEALRPGAAEPLLAWREHALLREAPLDRRQRLVIAGAVAACLGDAASWADASGAASGAAGDAALIAAADEVTLAPWRLGAGTVARLREAGFSDDAVLFDVLATAAACTTFSRIRVALAALGAGGPSVP